MTRVLIDAEFGRSARGLVEVHLSKFRITLGFGHGSITAGCAFLTSSSSSAAKTVSSFLNVGHIAVSGLFDCDFRQEVSSEAAFLADRRRVQKYAEGIRACIENESTANPRT